MPETPAPAAPPAPPAQRTVRWSLALVSVNLILLAVAPWGGTWALLTGPAGVVVAILALVRLSGVERMRPLRIVLAVGIAASVLATLYGMGMLILRGPFEAQAQCLDRALTHSAERECRDQFIQDYEDLARDLGVTLP